MAYATSNFNLLLGSPLTQIDNTGSIGGFGMWGYTTTDSESTVKGSGYVSDATNKGVQVGDLVWVINQSTPAAYLLQVASISSGAATLGASVVIT